MFISSNKTLKWATFIIFNKIMFILYLQDRDRFEFRDRDRRGRSSGPTRGGGGRGRGGGRAGGRYPPRGNRSNSTYNKPIETWDNSNTWDNSTAFAANHTVGKYKNKYQYYQ